MSLNALQTELKLRSFPRVSGDEPHTMNMNAMTLGFSPRERG